MTKCEEIGLMKTDRGLDGPALVLFNYMAAKTAPGKRQIYLTYTAATAAGLKISPSEYKTALFELVAKGCLSPAKNKFRYNVGGEAGKAGFERLDRSAEPDFWKAATDGR